MTYNANPTYKDANMTTATTATNADTPTTIEGEFSSAWDEATAPPSETPAADVVTAKDDAIAAAAAGVVVDPPKVDEQASDTDHASEAAASVGADGSGSGGSSAPSDGTKTPVAGAAAETPPAEPAVEPPATPEVSPELKALQDRLAAQEAEIATLRKTPAAAPAPVDETPPVEKPIYTTEEQAKIAKHKEEWGDMAEAEALIRRGEHRELVKFVFAQVHQHYAPILERALATSQQVAITTTEDAIKQVHPDYSDDMIDAVTAWAKGLTGMDKRVAEAIIEDGEPAEIIDLVTKYKGATGKGGTPRVVVDNTTAAAKPAVAPAAKAKTDSKPLSPQAIQAAAALAATNSKRTATGTGTPDASDFDGAWDEATTAAAAK